jgi:hypothetical protein
MTIAPGDGEQKGQEAGIVIPDLVWAVRGNKTVLVIKRMRLMESIPDEWEKTSGVWGKHSGKPATERGSYWRKCEQGHLWYVAIACPP